MMLKQALLAAVAAVALVSRAGDPPPDRVNHPFTRAYVKATLNRDYPSFYKCGEEIVLTYSFENVKGKIDPNRYIVYEWVDHDGDNPPKPFRTFVPEAGKTYEARTKLDHPGVVRFWIEVWDTVLNTKLSRNDCHGRAVRVFKTCFVEPEKMQSVPEPADYDAFWKRHREILDKVPMNAKLEKASGGADKTVYKLHLDCAGPAPVTGYISIPAKPGKYPAHLVTDGFGGPFTGSGAQSGCQFANPNEIVIHINAHGYELGRDKQYYIDFMKNASLHGYQLVQTKDEKLANEIRQRNADPETCYFAGMTWRIMRALDYVKTRPEWNGKDLYATGVSQGGLQTIWAAALDPQVTWSSVQVPWSCEFGGRETLHRVPCRLLFGETPAMRYYDPVNMAKRIKGSFDIARAGLADYTSPPSGIQVFYNNLKCPKRVIWYDRMEHKQMPFIRHRFFEETDRLNELITGVPEGRWTLVESGKDAKTGEGGFVDVKRLPDGHYAVKFGRPGAKVIDFSDPRYEADVNASAGHLTIRYRSDDGAKDLPFEETKTTIVKFTPQIDGSLHGSLQTWWGNEGYVNGIENVSIKGTR